MSQENQNEDLNKSIDALIDELFVDDTNIEKSIDIAGDSKTLADKEKAPKGQDDDSRGAGRPKQISDVPEKDEDGKRDGQYDASISEQGKEQDQPEASQVKESNQIKARGGDDAKAPKMAPFKKSNGEEVTSDEWNEFEEFKKSQEANKIEELKKAKLQEQTDLIKSVVEQTASRFTSEVESLKKSLNEQKEIVKSFASKPRASKSITNVEAVEKSFDNSGASKQESFTKSEVADAAVELAMNKSCPEFNDSHAIEVENNGYIYDETARKALEKYLQTK